MANYTKATNFAAKDSLPSGNSGKIVKGTEIDTEFTAIASAVSSKADLNSPVFTGTPTAPTAAAGTNTTQLATTAFVKTATDNLNLGTMSTQNANNVSITGGTITGITDLAVADGGTGASSFQANAVLLGNGSSSFQVVAPGANDNALISNGTTWTSQPIPRGTVTSITAGNGLQGGTITSSGTISLAAPSFNSVGSYTLGVFQIDGSLLSNALVSGSNYSAGSSIGQIENGGFKAGGTEPYFVNNLSGTWKWMSAGISIGGNGERVYGVVCRVS